VTIHAFTNADDWFTFHKDESDHETMDQQMLEQCWRQLHAAMPELGDAIEVIDTATPRTFYEDTRRKLGMVGSPSELSQPHPPSLFSHRTPFPNLFRVGDTCFPGGGIAGVSQSALIVAKQLTK
jgi:phytoene dehydrogenase-like protein